jgi:hypothetical protein
MNRFFHSIDSISNIVIRLLILIKFSQNGIKMVYNIETIIVLTNFCVKLNKLDQKENIL